MSIEDKAMRLIRERRVTVTYRTDDILAGRVQGDTGTYDVVIDPETERCGCPSWRRCSHIIALDAFEALSLDHAM